MCKNLSIYLSKFKNKIFCLKKDGDLLRKKNAKKRTSLNILTELVLIKKIIKHILKVKTIHILLMFKV